MSKGVTHWGRFLLCHLSQMFQIYQQYETKGTDDTKGNVPNASPMYFFLILGKYRFKRIDFGYGF